MTDIDESEILEDIEEMPKPKLIKSKMVKPKDTDTNKKNEEMEGGKMKKKLFY